MSSGAAASFTNSTVGNNMAVGGDSGVRVLNGSAYGGGIYLKTTGTVEFSHCTIAHNQAVGGGGALDLTDTHGGGVYSEGSGQIQTANSIIADNRSVDSNDIYVRSFRSFGNNLIGAFTSNELVKTVSSDLAGTVTLPLAPGLEDLANNGGGTETFALLPSSPAVNAGTDNPVFDQRGFGRRDTADIGAFELNANQLPVAADTIVKASAGTPLSQQIFIVDADNDPITVTSTDLPSWLQLVRANGVTSLVGTPPVDSGGMIQATLNVSDGFQSVTANVTINVSANRPPSIAVPDIAAVANVAVSQPVLALDPDGELVTVTSGNLPAWLSLQQVNGVPTLVGKPTADDIGTVRATLNVSDGLQTVSTAVTISVAANQPPSIAIPNITAVANVPLSQPIVAVDPEGDPVTVTASNLPAWLSIQQVNGVPTLVGTPTENDNGLSRITLNASDGNQVASASASLKVGIVGIELTDDGLLRVNGTEFNDLVRIALQNDNTVLITRNGYQRSFAAGRINRIQVYAFTGNDDIAIDDGTTRCVVFAGAGSDTVTTGSGNDYIVGSGGNDVIASGNGRDRIDGDAGNDTIFGGNGNDTMHGCSGNDVIDAGNGRDRVYGDDGDDLLYVLRGKRNFIDGGVGNNSGYWDDDDNVVGVQNRLTL